MPSEGIVEVRADDAASLEEWHGVIDANFHERWPDEPGWQRVELGAALADRDGPLRSVGFAARGRDGGLVGAMWLELSRVDNRHLATMMELGVLRAHRRRGHGRALVEAAARFARADGRTVLAAFHDEPSRLADSSPAPGLAAACGFEPVLVNIRRDLALPVASHLLDQLDARCSPRAAGYSVLGWRGAWPEAWLDDRSEMGRRMSTDTPMGGFEFHEEHWDPDRVRRRDALLARQDRDMIVTAARHHDSGRLVSFTEVAVPRGAPSKAYQQDTLVLEAHRGHRLGTLVKVANLRQLMAAWPETEQVATWNADSNRWMIAVNQALGFQVRGTGTTWQARPGSREWHSR